jgi:DNA modification methylase
VIDEHGVVLAGNGVREAAETAGIRRVRVIDASGEELIAVRRTGLSDDDKRALTLYDNRAAELAEWNIERLRADALSGLDLKPFFFDRELYGLIGATDAKQGLTDPDVVPIARETDIQPGDLFALGTHRLLCGDSTDEAAVARLLGREKPALMVTDPPYGVEYDPEWRAKAGVNKNRKKMGVVANDVRADWTPAWRLFHGDIAYVWHAGLFASVVQASLEQAGFVMRAQVIWAKDRLALSRGDYHWQHEPCWYAIREGAPGLRTDDRTQSTLWTIPARDDAGHGHGTQKPVACMARPMRNHRISEVYDPFVGSGTSLIAAEQHGLRCFALELVPTYVQIAIDRWEAFTGQRATPVGGG